MKFIASLYRALIMTDLSTPTYVAVFPRESVTFI